MATLCRQKLIPRKEAWSDPALAFSSYCLTFIPRYTAGFVGVELIVIISTKTFIAGGGCQFQLFLPCTSLGLLTRYCLLSLPFLRNLQLRLALDVELK